MEFHNEFLDQAAKILAEEIDKELVESITSEQLKDDGWIVCDLFPPKWPFDRPSWKTDTAEWCHKHCSGNYSFLNGRWHFEKAEDATMFALKWA